MAEPAAGVYLYGVIRDGEAVVLDMPPIGGEGTVYMIVHRGLAAVVSDDPADRRYELTRKNVRGHQAVIDGVMRTSDILPTRMGVVLPSAGAVIADFLEKRWAELSGLLDHVRGRIEFGVKASWTDLRSVFGEVVAADRDLRTQRDRLARRQAISRDERLSLGNRASQALEARRIAEADRLAAALEREAAAFRTSKPVSELMVLNGAFLVDRARAVAFERAVQELDDQHSGRISFMLAGPLPPYSFVSLNDAQTAGSAR